MKLDRRDFLRLTGAAGMALMLPTGPARAQGNDKRRWIFVHAGGGWDPTSLCDPKGRRNEEEENPMNYYFTGDIGTAGNIRYAPVAWNREFFEKHHRNTLVINGVDTQTNNHDAGVRHTWSGKLSEGYPALAALIAGVQAADKPMAFVTNGGYDRTQGLVAPTRTGNIGAVNRIAFPNSVDGNSTGETYHSPRTMERIQQALKARRPHLEQTFQLPKAHHAISQLYTAQSGENEIRRLSEFLPEEFRDEGLQRQAQVVMAAFKADVAKTANLVIGGFDTHGNHDDSHFPRLDALMRGVDFIWEEAERQGIADDLVVMVGSDFGRTPGYNEGNGKDHWSITSVLLMGAGIPGNKVIGSTDERHSPHTVDVSSLERSDSGIRIEPKHIHRALRKLAGVADAPDAERLFPLVGAEDLPLLA